MHPSKNLHPNPQTTLRKVQYYEVIIVTSLYTETDTTISRQVCRYRHSPRFTSYLNFLRLRSHWTRFRPKFYTRTRPEVPAGARTGLQWRPRTCFNNYQTVFVFSGRTRQFSAQLKPVLFYAVFVLFV